MTSHGMARSWWLLLVLLLAAGCGSDDGRADSGSPADSGARTDAIADPGSCTVQVVYQGKSTPVDLGKLTPVSISGADYVRLSEVVLLALPGKDLALLLVDFEAADGFKPGTKSDCVSLIPMAGATLAKGYVSPQSGNLRWDDSLAYPGCLAVKNLGKILVSDK